MAAPSPTGFPRAAFRSPVTAFERAIRHAEVRDLVGRNVTALVKAPAGRSGGPSKSLTLEQAQDLLRAAGGPRLHERAPSVYGVQLFVRASFVG